jgi:hypothetical protein
MRKILAIFLFSLAYIVNPTYCQQLPEPADRDQMDYKRDTMKVSDETKTVKTRKLNTGIEVGTSFSYSPHNYYGPSFYLAPNISYKLSPKVMLQGGIIFEKSNFYPLYKQDGPSNDILPMTRTFLYARGSYLLAPNLTVGGTVYKSIDNIPKLSKYQEPYQYNIQGMQLDFQYKVSNSITIGFQVRQQNSNFIPLNTY